MCSVRLSGALQSHELFLFDYLLQSRVCWSVVTNYNELMVRLRTPKENLSEPLSLQSFFWKEPRRFLVDDTRLRQGLDHMNVGSSGFRCLYMYTTPRAFNHRPSVLLGNRFTFVSSINM